MIRTRAPGAPRLASTLNTPPAAADCHHCGARVDAAARWRCTVDGTSHAFCCAGCMAVAQTIAAAGLASYYTRRSAPASTPAAEDDDWDRCEVASAAYLGVTSDGTHEMALLVDGIHCAACVWLIETWLARAPGVASAAVNLATRRARVRFDPSRTSPSAILRAVRAVGYRAFPYDPRRREAVARREARSLLARAAVAVLASMQVMMLAVPGYTGEGIDAEHRAVLDWAGLALTLPVMLYSAAPFFAAAARDFRRRRLGMDVPVALGAALAFAASAWATVAGGTVYYDSVSMFVALLLVARYVELVGRQKAASALEAGVRELPPTAVRLPGYPEAAPAAIVPASSLVAGDCVRVMPGETVAADGVVVEGRSSVEEAVLTGESAPRAKRAGDTVLAGSINRESPLIVRVSAAGTATVLAGIARCAEDAANARPATARAADRVAAVFVAALLAIAAVTALVWWHIDAARVLPVTFAVLIVSCPCALSLATPAALAATAGALVRRGVIVVRSGALETLAKVTHVVLDKTGTLTTGRIALRSTLPLSAHDARTCLAIAAALEQASGHPIARAFDGYARMGTSAHDVVVVPGQGVEGTVDATRYRIGRPFWVGELHGQGLPPEERDAERDATPVALGDAAGWLAHFTVGDALKPGASALVGDLVRMRIGVSIASGDAEGAVRAVARRAGVDDYASEATPLDKSRCVAALQARGEVVAMLGDGVNDTPGLARADVAVSLASAAALPAWTADVVLMRDDVRLLAEAIAIARRGFRVIRQNLAWAIVYNALAIPLAASGELTPLAAAVGMSASSLIVVGNALRVLRAPRPARPDPAARRAQPAARGA